jgi:hypothetical protein
VEGADGSAFRSGKQRRVLGVSQRTISNDCSESEQKALSPEALASIKDSLAECPAKLGQPDRFVYPR